MTPTFNLIDRPWIPCLTLDGQLEKLGLRALFQRSNDLRAIHCESPIMTVAVLPVALTILHRVFGPERIKDWLRLWDGRQFPAEPLGAYFDQWYERFDLFHPVRPFYQARDERVKPRSVIHLVQSIANTGALFTHDDERVGEAVTPAEAARRLVTANLFRTSGLSGLDEKFTDGVFSRGVLFWAWGTTLFETLMLNLMRYPHDSVMRWTAEDAPAWEMNDAYHPRQYPHGYLDYLTWQSNRIWLEPDIKNGNVTVSMITVAPGLTMSSDVKCPQKRYIKRTKNHEVTWSFMYFDTQKALWRDYHSLLPRQPDDDLRPPMVVDWLGQVDLDAHYPLRLLASGMLADQAKVIFYRQEEVPLPPQLLHLDNSIQNIISEAIQRADDVGDKLRTALSIMADCVLQRGAEGKPNCKEHADLTRQWDAMGLYWGLLEPPFWAFVESLTIDDPDAEQTWNSTLIDAAQGAFGEAERMAGSTPWALRGAVNARRYLRFQLRDLFESIQ